MWPVSGEAVNCCQRLSFRKNEEHQYGEQGSLESREWIVQQFPAVVYGSLIVPGAMTGDLQSWLVTWGWLPPCFQLFPQVARFFIARRAWRPLKTAGNKAEEWALLPFLDTITIYNKWKRGKWSHSLQLEMSVGLPALSRTAVCRGEWRRRAICSRETAEAVGGGGGYKKCWWLGSTSRGEGKEAAGKNMVGEQCACVMLRQVHTEFLREGRFGSGFWEVQETSKASWVWHDVLLIPGVGKETRMHILVGLKVCGLWAYGD